MSITDKIKLFAMSTQVLERELDYVESSFNIDLDRDVVDEKDDDYYPQFQEHIRKNASYMSKHYELFFSLENSIRSLIKSKLESQHDATWWDKCVPDDIKNNVRSVMQRELSAAVSKRSTSEIDYTNFGDLSTIVTNNWDIFSDTFNDQKGFQRVMWTLNVLRGPIAHCAPYQEDEVVRLRLLVRDWFRLME